MWLCEGSIFKSCSSRTDAADWYVEGEKSYICSVQCKLFLPVSSGCCVEWMKEWMNEFVFAPSYRYLSRGCCMSIICLLIQFSFKSTTETSECKAHVTNSQWQRVPGPRAGSGEAAWSISRQSTAWNCQIVTGGRTEMLTTSCRRHRSARLLGTTAPCDEGTWTPSCPACTECVVSPAANEGRDTWCLWCCRTCAFLRWVALPRSTVTGADASELHTRRRVYCCNSQHDKISGHEWVSLRRQWTTAYGVWHAVVVAGRSSFQPVSSHSLQKSTDCQSKR